MQTIDPLGASPAASSFLQWRSQAAHVTAKAATVDAGIYCLYDRRQPVGSAPSAD